MQISIIGAGRMGGALAIALSKKNYLVRQIVVHRRDISRIVDLISPAPEILSFDELEKISGAAVFITTPDSEIQATANLLQKKLAGGTYVFHTSGALSSEILNSLKDSGCRVGSLHPLIAVSDPVAGAKNFRNAYFCVEGEPSAVRVAEQIVTNLGGKSFTVPTECKAFYHASAVMASGHLTTIFAGAVEMLAACSLSEIQAQEILLPLAISTIQNLRSQNPAQALTGPFARADVKILRLHLAALAEKASPDIFEIYRQLGLQALHLAEKQNANPENLVVIKDLLLSAER